MDDEKLLNLLKKNGLGERESKVYAVLLKNPNSTPTQIHNLVGIIRTKIYEVLSSLLSKDVITEELVGKKKAYRVINPETAFDTLVKRKEHELLSYKENNQKLVSLATEIYKQTESDATPYYRLEHLSDPGTITDRCSYYIGRAKKELLVFSKPPYVNISGKFDEELDDNVKMRTIQEYLPQPQLNEILTTQSSNPNDEFRFIDELPLKLFVIDSKISILALGSNGSKVGQINTIFLDEPIIALFMKEIFESRWKRALTLKEFTESRK